MGTVESYGCLACPHGGAGGLDIETYGVELAYLRVAQTAAMLVHVAVAGAVRLPTGEKWRSQVHRSPGDSAQRDEVEEDDGKGVTRRTNRARRERKGRGTTGLEGAAGDTHIVNYADESWPAPSATMRAAVESLMKRLKSQR